MSEKKEINLYLRVSKDVHKQVIERAKENNRTVANWLETVVLYALKQTNKTAKTQSDTNPIQINTNAKPCSDCGDLAELNKFGRCEGCQAEYEYQQAMKEK